MKKKDNMKSNMPLNDEDCIRYLMREMDPSEEIEFEREMMQNENLLIEVESLRSTYNKVRKLPLKETPSHLLESVQAQAVQDQKKNLRAALIPKAWHTKVAAAAVVLIAISGAFIYSQSDNEVNTFRNQVGTQSASPVQPWVDRNEVLNISDRIDENRAKELIQDFENSYNKLMLVKDQNTPTTPQRQGVLLTSSPSQ